MSSLKFSGEPVDADLLDRLNGYLERAKSVPDEAERHYAAARACSEQVMRELVTLIIELGQDNVPPMMWRLADDAAVLAHEASAALQAAGLVPPVEDS